MGLQQFTAVRKRASVSNAGMDKHTVQRELAKLGYSKLAIKGHQIRVLVSLPVAVKQVDFRKQTLTKILNYFSESVVRSGATYSSNPKISSLGGVVFANSPVSISVKDAAVQATNSAGVANEIQLSSLIQRVINQHKSADVTFIDGRGKTLAIHDVTQVVASGQDVKNRKKADVVLVSATQQLPISVKKLTADTWESADSAFGAKAQNIINQLIKQKIVTLTQLPSGAYKLSKEIVIEPTDEEAMAAVFGTDINPRGGIVIQSFDPRHFTQNGNDVHIECHAVIKTTADIPTSHRMVWLLRNDATRSSAALGIPGIRILASVLTRAIGVYGTKDVILVDKNGCVVKGNN